MGPDIFDQHAARERKTYKEMKTEFSEKSSKMLLIPSHLRLSNDQQIFIEEIQGKVY